MPYNANGDWYDDPTAGLGLPPNTTLNPDGSYHTLGPNDPGYDPTWGGYAPQHPDFVPSVDTYQTQIGNPSYTQPPPNPTTMGGTEKPKVDNGPGIIEDIPEPKPNPNPNPNPNPVPPPVPTPTNAGGLTAGAQQFSPPAWAMPDKSSVQLPPLNFSSGQMSAAGMPLSDLITQLRGLMNGGAFNQSIVNNRTEAAQEILKRFASMQDKSDQAQLAARGLDTSGAAGPDITAMDRLNLNTNNQFANALEQIQANESQNADQRMMGALGDLTNLTEADWQNIIAKYEAQTGRDLGQGQLNLGMQSLLGNLGLGYSGLNLQSDLGTGNLNLGLLSQQIAQNLGLGNLNLENLLGQGQLNLGQQTIDLNKLLGTGNLALGNLNATNNYNLGLGNLNLQQQLANAGLTNQSFAQLIQLLQILSGNASTSSQGHV